MPEILFDPARGQRVVRHVSAMADAHVAHGVAVGTVFATAGTVVPRALGGDLGCGIAATRLSLASACSIAERWSACSHGAGRVLTRTEARARIRPEALARAMRRVVWPERLARRLVEEAPAAYRDLGEVLEDQEDLVQRERRLEPIAVLKG